MKNADPDKRYGTEFGSARWRALNDERAAELRSQIEKQGDFPVPGCWTSAKP